MLLFLNKSFNYFTLSWIKLLNKSKSVIPGELFASISPDLISAEKLNIMKVWPWQRRTRDPEQIYCGIWTNVKMDGRICSKFQGRGNKIDRVNSARVAKSIIFFNIFRAICTVSDAIMSYCFLCVELLLPLVYVLWFHPLNVPTV